MILLDKKLLKQVEFEAEVAEHNFIMLRCKKCIDTPLMKKRDCNLLYGYREPCCNLMDKFVEKETKRTNKKILIKAIQDILNNVKSC